MTECLMLLPSKTGSESISGSGSERVFVCKTCNRKFSTFQALGGHRASHKKLKLLATDLCSSSSSSNSKAKKIHHECSICGLVFPLGQALGGHMRRHRSHHHQVEAPVVLDDNDDDDDESNKGRGRVVFFLDLNLSPYENDLES